MVWDAFAEYGVGVGADGVAKGKTATIVAESFDLPAELRGVAATGHRFVCGSLRSFLRMHRRHRAGRRIVRTDYAALFTFGLASSMPAHHGQESFFVVGEGLVGTQLGGRHGNVPDPVNESEDPSAPATRALAAAEAPPFRFSRCGPKGEPLGPAVIKKLAVAMVQGGGGQGDVPAGYTYVGQFVDHDLTFDRTDVALGEDVTPAELVQGRSPRLDLDSLLRHRAGQPGIGQVLRGRRAAPQDRQHHQDRLRRLQEGPRPASGQRRAHGADPRPAQRREPHRRPDPPGDDPLPQQGRRRPAGLHARGPAVPQGPQAGHAALPVDAAPRLPAADRRPRRPRRRVRQRPQARRAGRRADRRTDDAAGVLGRGVPARSQHDPRLLQLEPPLPRHGRLAVLHVRLLRASAAASAAS